MQMAVRSAAVPASAGRAALVIVVTGRAALVIVVTGRAALVIVVTGRAALVKVGSGSGCADDSMQQVYTMKSADLIDVTGGGRQAGC